MRSKTERYLSRTNDVVFKLLFSWPYRSDAPPSRGRLALVQFLTNVLRPESPIRQVALANPAITPRRSTSPR